MELKDFLNKTVIDPRTGRRYSLCRITAPEIEVADTQPGKTGHCPHYIYKTITQDPISAGSLVFEDASLKAPFLAAYNAYCRTEDAYWEQYGYWMGRD